MSFNASPDIPDDDRCACGDPFDLHDSLGNKLCTQCASGEDYRAFIDGDPVWRRRRGDGCGR